MSFLDNIKGFNFSNKVLENTSIDLDKEIESIAKRVDDEVGGSDDEAIIDAIIDDVSYDILDGEKDEKYSEMIKSFSNLNKLDSFIKYKDIKIEKMNNISKNLEKDSKKIYSSNDKTRDEGNADFLNSANKLNLELDRTNKLIDIYKTALETGVDEKAEPKIKKIIDNGGVIAKIANLYRKVSSEILKNLDKLVGSKESNDIVVDQVEDTLDKSGISIININIGGRETPVKEEIKKIKEKEESKKPADTKKERDFIKSTISKLRDSYIPEYQDGQITKKGGFFENISSIKAQYENILMDLINRKAIDFGENEMYLSKENPDVKYQISYLDATRAFLDYMIENYISTKRDRDKLKRLVDSLYLEKSAYIKNKNLSRKINMSDFAGLKIKREIKIPLYKTVDIPITDEDIIANSKFSKFKKVMQGLAGILGPQKSYVDQSVARVNKAQNRAILQLINNVSKSVAGVVGGEKAKKSVGLGMKKAANVLNMELKESVSEDMVMPVDGASQPGLLFDTPQSVPGGMDTFAKLGPGKRIKPKKKKKSKKKKSTKSSNVILRFDDFINK